MVVMRPETDDRKAVEPLPYEEIALVLSCQKGDSAAWGRFDAKYRPAIYRHAFSIVRNREDAEDVTAQTLARIFRSITTFRRDSPLIPWIHRIAQNTALTFLRRKRSAMPIGSLHVSNVGDSGEELDLPDRSPGPLEQSIYNESCERYSRAIGNLPRYQRTVLIKHILDGLPYDEIALQVGIPLGTVKSRMARARRTLRERLELN